MKIRTDCYYYENDPAIQDEPYCDIFDDGFHCKGCEYVTVWKDGGWVKEKFQKG